MLTRVFNGLLRASSLPRCRLAYSTSSLGRMATTFGEIGAQQQQAKQLTEAQPVPVIPFRSGTPIRPHDLAYDARVPPKTPRRKPVQVAPTSREARRNDIFEQLNIDPLSLATYPVILAHFVTEMGQIKPRTQTGLTVKSQRRLGKAIRRARMMGVLPILSKSPDARWQ